MRAVESRNLPARAAPVVVGSHLDSVAQGGNFDGAAGVVSGLTACAALRDAGVLPPRDVRVMGIRAEESAWFGVSYIGSRCALGTLPPGALDDARRSDTGVSLHLLTFVSIVSWRPGWGLVYPHWSNGL